MVPQMLIFILQAITKQKSRLREIPDLLARWRPLDTPPRNQINVSLEDGELEGSEDLAMGVGRGTVGHETYIIWKKYYRGYVSPCKALREHVYTAPYVWHIVGVP